jgi:hypothetical protein
MGAITALLEARGFVPIPKAKQWGSHSEAMYWRDEGKRGVVWIRADDRWTFAKYDGCKGRKRGYGASSLEAEL